MSETSPLICDYRETPAGGQNNDSRTANKYGTVESSSEGNPDV